MSGGERTVDAMDEETRTIIVTQNEGDRFTQEHHGAVALYGDRGEDPLQHRFGGEVVHATLPQRPLVHMVCWDQDDVGRVEVTGQVTLAGDEAAPLHLRMRHEFANDHHQSHSVAPLDHALQVTTRLAEPIHHALQMRTPVQLRFCNPWHIVSDYALEIGLGNNRRVSLRLTGATICTPQPCQDAPCPPPDTQPGHP